jgi:hypothetical protein
MLQTSVSDLPKKTRDRQGTQERANKYVGSCGKTRHPKNRQRRNKKLNAPTNNQPKDGEHINEEGTEIDTDPECSTQADPSLPIVQEQDTLNTDADKRCNAEQPGTTETEIKDSRKEEDEKYCDEPYTGPKPRQHANPKPTTTGLSNGNKTTERVNTNRVDKTNSDIIQNPQGGMGDTQDVRSNPQRPKILKLEGNGEPSAERKKEQNEKRDVEKRQIMQCRPHPPNTPT